MSKWDNLVIWIGINFFCLSFLFFSPDQRFFSWDRNKEIFNENFPYFLPKIVKTFDYPDSNIAEAVFLGPKTPPFLIEGKKLAVVEEKETTNKEIKEYIVEKGDTLISISQKFNISLETLLWSNELSINSYIKPGQKLIILPVSGVLHIVKQGESLTEIARFYKAEIKKIIEFNQLVDKNNILAGDLLIIPDGKIALQFKNQKENFKITQIPIGDTYFMFPTEGKITQKLHGILSNAIDIGNNCGTPVVAVANGRIQRISNTSIGGLGITLLHPNGVVTYYAHLSKILVQPSQEVTAGEIIGYMGNTGRTRGKTGCHLHFEVRNALNFLAKYPLFYHLQWGK